MKKHIAEQFELPIPKATATTEIKPASKLRNMTRCPNCNEPLAKSYCWFCQRIVTSKDIVAIFDRLRFDPETHLGNGDVKLSLEKQREIIDLLKKT